MFSNAEDEEFFNPTSASNLASLFGTSMTFKQDANASLIYTAPKQPKVGGQETPKGSPKSTSQSSVIVSKFADVFKLLDKNYASQGKCGIAIIGNQSLNAYEIIIYKTKQDIIMRSKLTADFICTVQSNNFIYFCDDQKQQWSARFENTKEVDSFAQEIQSHGGKIALNKSTDSCDSTSQSFTTGTKPKTNENPVNVTSSVVGRDKDSDSTSDNSSNQTRANILSRMAKMGQSILPINLPKNSSGRSDSETDDQTQNRKPVKKRQKPVLVKAECLPADPVQNLNNQTLNLQTAAVPEFVMINGQLVPIATLKQNLPTSFPTPLHTQYIQNIPNQIMLSQPQVSPMSDSLHVFIAENRTHNCELRMNMSQLSSKLDQVLSKLYTSGPVTLDESSTVEFKMAEQMKELEVSREIIQDLEGQIKLHETSVGDKELINNLKRQNEDKEKLILNQEQKIRELEKQKGIFQEQITHNNSIQKNLEEAQQTINDLRQSMDEQQVNLKKFETFYEENKGNQNSEIAAEKLNESITNLKGLLTEKSLKANLFAGKLKQSMNLLYQEIMENFEDENIAFQSIQIKQILSQKLKAATFTIIQEFQNDFKDSEAISTKQSGDLTPAVSQFE